MFGNSYSIIISGSRNVYKQQQQGPLLVRNGGIRTTTTKTTRMFQLASSFSGNKMQEGEMK